MVLLQQQEMVVLVVEFLVVVGMRTRKDLEIHLPQHPLKEIQVVEMFHLHKDRPMQHLVVVVEQLQ